MLRPHFHPSSTGEPAPCIVCNQLSGHTDTCRLRPITLDERREWIKGPITREWPSAGIWCRRCLTPGVHHPRTVRIVGCPKCGLITTSIFATFHYKLPEEARSGAH